jgi:ribonuclease Z
LRALILLAIATIVVVPSHGNQDAATRTSAAGEALRVTLLGTGTPGPSIDRFGPSILVEAASETLLFDAGRGATIRLTQAGISLRRITATFLTHLHSDHVNGLADLWLTGWIPGSFGGRTTPFRIFGPTGTREMMSHLEQAHAADIRIRTVDEKLPVDGIAIRATDVTEGVVYEQHGVRVVAFDVDHGEHIKPALGYRIDYGGHAVLLSGDTRYSQNLIKYASGVDVLVHEVMLATTQQLASPSVAAGMAHHTSPEQAGEVFAAVKPRLAVYSHLALFGNSTNELIRRTRTTYAGPLEVGEDLMQIDVTTSPVVRRGQSLR